MLGSVMQQSPTITLFFFTLLIVTEIEFPVAAHLNYLESFEVM